MKHTLMFLLAPLAASACVTELDTVATDDEVLAETEQHANDLDWYLDTIGYRWRGVPAQPSTVYTGTALSTFSSSEAACQYTCETTSDCDAYNYVAASSTCRLLSDVTGVSSSSVSTGGLRHGASSGKTSDIVGLVDAQDRNVVVERMASGSIRKRTLVPGVGWSTITLASPAAATAAKVSAVLRSDGVAIAVYRSAQNQLIQVNLDTNTWSALTTALAPVGDPVAYVRGDGITAIAFRVGNGHIRELRLVNGTYAQSDLTPTLASPGASSDPSAYVRSDGYTAVVFTVGTQIRELYKLGGEAWTLATPKASAPAAIGKPYGYTKLDGTNTIVYRSAGSIMELLLGPSGWTSNVVINTQASGDPVGYVRTDAKTSILYRGSASVFEVVNYQAWNLSSATGSTTSGEPMPYVRSDQYNTVLHRASSGGVGELVWKRGMPQWQFGTL